MSEKLHKIRPPKVKIMLDKERTLVYDLNAFAELEEIFGSVEKALNALSEGKLKALIAILYAGLVHEDETLTPKKVGSLIGLENLNEVAEAINKAIISALPESDKKEIEKDPNENIPPQN